MTDEKLRGFELLGEFTQKTSEFFDCMDKIEDFYKEDKELLEALDKYSEATTNLILALLDRANKIFYKNSIPLSDVNT